MSPTLDPAGFAEIAGACPPAVAESTRRARSPALRALLEAAIHHRAAPGAAQLPSGDGG